MVPPSETSPSTSLDLSGASTSLDLSSTAPAAGSTSLGLSTPAPAAAGAVTTPPSIGHRAPSRPLRRPGPSAAAGDEVLGFSPRRLTAGRRTHLTDSEPTVVLTRLQSGVGALTIRAVVPSSTGDLRLAAAWGLRSGESSLLSAARGVPLAPPRSSRPVITSTGENAEILRVDLRQVTALDRLLVLAYSQSGAPLAWGGALVVETFGKARADVSLHRPPAAGVLVPLSVYNVDGQLVLRAEDELLVGGTLRDAALTYGFDRISWIDPWTPLT